MKISIGNIVKEVKAVYIGTENGPEKLWCKEDGEMSTEVKERILKAVIANG